MKIKISKSAAALTVIWLIFAVAVVGCGSGETGDNNGSNQDRSVQDGATTNNSSSTAGDSAKVDNEGNSSSTVATNQSGASSGVAPSDVSALPVMSSSVTAQESFSDGSISVSFYVEGYGNFTVQEKVAGSWETKKENVYYRGTGGLEAGSIASGGDAITLRLLKIDDGKYSAVSREITVKRSDVIAAGGIKSYQN
jgi:hypothetical protein